VRGATAVLEQDLDEVRTGTDITEVDTGPCPAFRIAGPNFQMPSTRIGMPLSIRPVSAEMSRSPGPACRTRQLALAREPDADQSRNDDRNDKLAPVIAGDGYTGE